MEKVRLTSLVMHLRPDQVERLAALTKQTKVRQAEYLCEAIADLLTKYEDTHGSDAEGG